MLRSLTTVAMSLAFLAAHIARAEAAELEGFGPVKFGMNKEEALEAIERRGEWVGSDLLRYILPIEVQRHKESLLVLQSFTNGQASDVAVRYSEGWPPPYCLSRSLYFVSEIKRKYQKEPLVSHGVLRELEHSEDKPRFVIDDLYVFMFDAGASINLRFTFRYDAGGCEITITYRPPSNHKSLF